MLQVDPYFRSFFLFWFKRLDTMEKGSIFMYVLLLH